MKITIFDPMLTWSAARLLSSLNNSLRWTFLSEYSRNALRELNRSALFMFWHNQQLMMPALYHRIGGAPGGVTALISQHRDGRLIARTMKYLGINSVAGSSTRGGRSALRNLSHAVRRGNHAAITPDGPRGPIYEIKPGIVQLAKLSGAPILPVCAVPRSYWEFDSWDNMRLPKPFTPTVLGVHKPIFVSSTICAEKIPEICEELKRALDDLNEEARELAERMAISENSVSTSY